MPKPLIDVYMATELSHLFKLYLRSRSTSTVVDRNLTTEKEKVVGEELESLRKILMGIDVTSPCNWREHLEDFKKSCENVVETYNDSNGTNNSSGELVIRFIKEAELFLAETEALFTLFGLDSVTTENITSDAYARQALLQMCMKRFYYPGDMKEADWEGMAEFRRNMNSYCGVAAAQDSEANPPQNPLQKDKKGKRPAQPEASASSPVMAEKNFTQVKETPLHFKSLAALKKAVETVLEIEEGLLKRDESIMKGRDSTGIVGGATSFLAFAGSKAAAATMSAFTAAYQRLAGTQPASHSPAQSSPALSSASLGSVQDGSPHGGKLHKSASSGGLSSGH